MQNQVLSCIFENITEKAININSNFGYSLVFSSFTRCTSKGDGGTANVRCKSMLICKCCFDRADTDGTGTAIYALKTNVLFNFSSVCRCSEIKKTANDALYFNEAEIFTNGVNSSYNSALQSCGFQGNKNSKYFASYLLAANGIGDCSLETTRQTIDTNIDHSLFINNNVPTYGVISIYEAKHVYCNNVILSGNVGVGFTGTVSWLHFEDCYYYGTYSIGVSGTPSGVSSLNSPTISWENKFISPKECYRQCSDGTLSGDKCISVILFFSISFTSK